MSPKERLYRRRLRAMVRAASLVSWIGWNCPTEKSEPYTEITKTSLQALDKATERAREVLYPKKP